jgi:uncharacterized repeat protein (TIGR03987 family)
MIFLKMEMFFILLHAVIYISLAFILYTIGVWSEKIQGELQLWHVIIFWLGLVNDTIGTYSMEMLIRGNSGNAIQNLITDLSLHLNFHSITGIIALILMLFHVVWATMVLIKKDVVMIKKFHQFSLFVWILWIIPFITGVLSHLV